MTAGPNGGNAYRLFNGLSTEVSGTNWTILDSSTTLSYYAVFAHSLVPKTLTTINDFSVVLMPSPNFDADSTVFNVNLPNLGDYVFNVSILAAQSFVYVGVLVENMELTVYRDCELVYSQALPGNPSGLLVNGGLA